MESEVWSMAKVVVIYYDRSGNTKAMAQEIAAGATEAGAAVELKSSDTATVEDLRQADGIVLGSPTYYGLPAPGLLQLIEETVRCHGALEGKVGGAFASSANVAGGNETTIMALVQVLLVHGMIVQGNPVGDHYGPVSIASPDSKTKTACRAYGKRVAELAHRLHNGA